MDNIDMYIYIYIHIYWCIRTGYIMILHDTSWYFMILSYNSNREGRVIIQNGWIGVIAIYWYTYVTMPYNDSYNLILYDDIWSISARGVGMTDVHFPPPAVVGFSCDVFLDFTGWISSRPNCSPEPWIDDGFWHGTSSPFMAKLFRLVKYSNSPR